MTTVYITIVCTLQMIYNTVMPGSPVTTQPQDICSPTPTEDPVHSKKTFRLFRKTTKKKVTALLVMNISYTSALVAQ